MEYWIAFTLLAAAMQAVRTAGQKQLARHITPMAATLVRYLFGLPFAIAYLVLVASDVVWESPWHTLFPGRFLVFATLASVAQVLATVLLVRVLVRRNFAVGSSLAKTEAIQTAVLGSLFFSAPLGLSAWLAVVLAVLGILCVSMPARGLRRDSASISLGLLSGLCFAATSVWLRQASLSLPYGFLESAALTLVFMVCQQTLICIAILALWDPQQIRLIFRYPLVCVFVGATSALGSVGWFTAMTLQNPALVKSLGQVEILFTLLLTHFFFRERLSAGELLGIVAIAGSVVLLLVYSG
jgi:drug/metabolite transporter (DMT)-like permease